MSSDDLEELTETLVFGPKVSFVAEAEFNHKTDVALNHEIDHLDANHQSVSSHANHYSLVFLPPSINYETLIAEGKNAGFRVCCLGYVEGVQSTMVVVLNNKQGWEVFIGLHHRLERMLVEVGTSYDFGSGIFLSGNNQRKESFSMVIPHEHSANLLPTLNGHLIKRY